MEAESRLLDAGQQIDGPVITMDSVAVVTGNHLPGGDHQLGHDQAAAVGQIAASGRSLDLLVGPAGTGKTTTMAGLRAVWENQFGPGSVLGLAPSAAAAEVLAGELGIETENTAKWLFEHHQEAGRLTQAKSLRNLVGSREASSSRRTIAHKQAVVMEAEVDRWRLKKDQLVIVEEASLAGTFALDELVTAAQIAGAKVLLVGDHAQLTAVEAGGMFAALVRDRGDLVTELTDVRRFNHDWEKAASVELRAGSPDVIDDYQVHDRITAGTRDEMLDALYGAWRSDIEAGQVSLMIAGDLGTVHELNARARVDRVASGQVTQDGLAIAGGATAGVGDHVVTRQNNRRLTTGRRWVRNGDQWTVTATNQDGSMTLTRFNGTAQVVLPAPYVTEHVDLAYASTAHRAQGRTVDTAHAMVSPTTTREVLYVSATRGREVNRLYVDTHYDPDPQTSHGTGAEPATTKEVLTGVLRNEGADAAAHAIIRRQQYEAEGMERLAAEYLTLATAAQEDRWNALLAITGLSEVELESVHSSDAFGPLLASLREAEANGLNVDSALPQLVSRQYFDGASGVASVLHGRVDRWTEAAGTLRRISGNYIAGLIPRAQGVTDPEMVQALTERQQAMEERSRTLAIQAIESGAKWIQRLGPVPSDSSRRARWVHEVSTVAAYRDRWHISGHLVIGSQGDVGSTEEMDQRQRAQNASERAAAVVREPNGKESSMDWEPNDEFVREVEL